MDFGALGSFGKASAVGYRPRCKLAAAGGAAGGGGLLDAAASLLSGPASDPWGEHLRAVEVVLGTAPALDVCRISLAYGPRLPAAALGDELSVELGYDAELTQVFQGRVARVKDTGDRGLELTLVSAARELAALRQNASFAEQSFGDVARQWASDAGVTPGNVESGPSYPFLAVDDRRSAWEWLAFLARLAGLWVWVDGAGELHCAEPEAADARTYRYGEDVVELRASEDAPSFGQLTVFGEGAAGSQGADAWSVLLKQADSVRASAGSGSTQRVVQHGALRSRAAVDGAARSVEAAASALARRVRATVLGSPELGVGSRFAITGAPAGRGDGSYALSRCVHRYDKRRGFVTELFGVSA